MRPVPGSWPAQGGALRIAYVALSARGGTTLYATGLASRVGRNAHVLYVGPEHLPGRERPEGVQYRSVRTGYTHAEVAWRTLRPDVYAEIAKAIKAFKPDLVHFPLSHPWNPLVALMLGSTPVVFTVHDPAPHTGAKWRHITEVTHQVMYRRASKIIALCQYSLGLLPQRFKSKAAVIPLPVFEHYRIAAVSPKPLRPSAVLFGRLEPYKGVGAFCEAAAQLSAEGLDADFTIAGPGRLRDCLRGAPPAAVTVINRFLSEQEVSQLLADASVMVLPYTDATQSGVLAAAYAAGLPVVATTVGSLPEFVQDGVSGLLVPPNDPPALAAAMRRVLLDPALRDRLSSGADALARTVLSWDEVAGRHYDLYTELVGKSASHAMARKTA